MESRDLIVREFFGQKRDFVIFMGQCHKILEKILSKKSTWASTKHAKTASRDVLFLWRYFRKTCVCVVVDHADTTMTARNSDGKFGGLSLTLKEKSSNTVLGCVYSSKSIVFKMWNCGLYLKRKLQVREVVNYTQTHTFCTLQSIIFGENEKVCETVLACSWNLQ